MADYIATERAFHGGRMVAPGQTVSFPDGEDAPAWAKPAGESKAEQKPKAAKADTRPDDAIAASKAKVTGMTGAA